MLTRVLSGLFLALGLALANTQTTRAADWQTFDQKAFDMAVASGKGVVLDFHADWCPVCKAQAPILAELINSEMTIKKGVVAFKANFDTETVLKHKLGVQKQSTIIIFKSGKEMTRSTGMTDRAELAELIAKAY